MGEPKDMDGWTEITKQVSFQSGLGKYATVKSVNDDFLYNEGMCSLSIRDPATNLYLFVNNSTGGPRHLRPLRKSTTKDTAEAVVAAVREHEAEVAALVPLVLDIDGKRVTVKHEIHHSMHDGANIKVCTIYCTVYTR